MTNEQKNYRLVHVWDIPSKDGKLPKYPFVLLSVDRTNWEASTANETEGLPAFERMVSSGDAAEIVYVPGLA